MTDYTISGIHPIRRVVWALLQAELGWSSSNYGGAVPIVTPQEQPELNHGESPYVIYNYSTQAAGVNHLLKEEQATFVIHGPDDKQLRAALNLFDSYFSSYDESAAYVNWWIQDHGSDNYKRFNFKWIRVVSAIGAGPTEQEAGSQDAVVTIRYQYTETGNPVDSSFVNGTFGVDAKGRTTFTPTAVTVNGNTVLGRPTPPA